MTVSSAYSVKEDVQQPLQLTLSADIDAEVGELSYSLEEVQHLRQDTIQYVEYCLGLAACHAPIPLNYILRFFKTIGDAICENYDRGAQTSFMG